MRYARIYPWRRTRRSRAPSNGPDVYVVAQFSAGYTTNMFGFDLRQGQGRQFWGGVERGPSDEAASLGLSSSLLRSFLPKRLNFFAYSHQAGGYVVRSRTALLS